MAAMDDAPQVGHGLLDPAVDPAADAGVGLVDSPGGQAAWIVEKFWAWAETPVTRKRPCRGTACSTTSCTTG